LARYKHLSVRKVALAELKPPERRVRELTPRQRERLERDEEIRNALNEAAAAPASEAVVIDLKGGQKLATLRAAVNRILSDEPREINFGVRGQSLIFSKGPIPGGRGRARPKGGQGGRGRPRTRRSASGESS
jgi:hypothetical protein